jgi:hypothetical protein
MQPVWEMTEGGYLAWSPDGENLSFSGNESIGNAPDILGSDSFLHVLELDSSRFIPLLSDSSLISYSPPIWINSEQLLVTQRESLNRNILVVYIWELIIQVMLNQIGLLIEQWLLLWVVLAPMCVASMAMNLGKNCGLQVARVFRAIRSQLGHRMGIVWLM